MMGRLTTIWLLSLLIRASWAAAEQTEDDADDSSDWESILDAYLAKPFALLSILCSYVMCREVILDQKARKGGPIPRMLMSVAVADILLSLAWFLGSWMVPSQYEHIVGSVGNQGTCTFQGMLTMMGLVGGLLSNVCLSVYYLLVVKYGWKDSDLMQREKWSLCSIWLVTIALTIYPIPLEMYNLVEHMCSLESYPKGCQGDECIRGGNAKLQQTLFAILPIGCLMTSMGIMATLILQVRKIEDKAKKYTFNYTTSVGTLPTASQHSMGGSSHVSGMNRPSMSRESMAVTVDRKKSTAVARQAIFYALAFLMTYLCGIIAKIQLTMTGYSNPYFQDFAWLVCGSSAGTFNFYVFSRVRAMKTPEGRVLRAVLFCICLTNVFRGCTCRTKDDDGCAGPNGAQQATNHAATGRDPEDETEDIKDGVVVTA